VVSGGAGFIGSHLCEALLGRGFRVLALDNLVTGSRANIEHLVGRDDFEFCDADVSEPVQVEGEVDFVLHFASPASPVDFPLHPIEIVRAGTFGTANMLELAAAKNARMVFASTSEVYGDPLVHPQTEAYWGNVNPIGVRGCYDESKRCGEAFVMAYHRARGVDTGIVRIFNTHGPRMRLDDGRVIPNFMTQALRGEPLTVFGDGSQTRSLCYVDDLVGGILAVMDSGQHVPFNIGNPHEVTMLELARTTGRITGSKSPIEFRALPEDDPRQRRPDISRARELLGWEPRVPLEDGLRKTLDYFRSALAGAAQSR
jgi:dTDP-glucose 4,6-dehydratase